LRTIARMSEATGLGRRILALANTRPSLARRDAALVTAILSLAAWLALVIITTSRHEFWRDEVRALSIARAARWPTDLIPLLKDEGHPLLWYLILYTGKTLVDTPLVLPIASVSVAFAAVAVLLFRSPFPLWVSLLFMFSALP